MFESVLNIDIDSNSTLQTECINELEKIFKREYAGEIIINNYTFLGVRGNYVDKENYCLNFKFSYKEFNIEFYIMYDQFEYYIEKNNIILEKCNLEYFNESTMVEKFVKYLKQDMTKLNIDFLEV